MSTLIVHITCYVFRPPARSNPDTVVRDLQKLIIGAGIPGLRTDTLIAGGRKTKPSVEQGTDFKSAWWFTIACYEEYSEEALLAALRSAKYRVAARTLDPPALDESTSMSTPVEPIDHSRADKRIA